MSRLHLVVVLLTLLVKRLLRQTNLQNAKHTKPGFARWKFYIAEYLAKQRIIYAEPYTGNAQTYSTFLRKVTMAIVSRQVVIFV